MNPILKLLWRWQGRRRMDHPDLGFRYTAIRKLGEVSSKGDVPVLLELLQDQSQVVRNATSNALISILRQENEESRMEVEAQIKERFADSTSLIEKLSLIESMQAFSLSQREEILGPLVQESQNDLQHAIIMSLRGTHNEEILDDILDASDTQDLVLRRIALDTWYTGIAEQDKEILDYATPRLHYLVRASYELQTDGEFLRTILSYAEKGKLPLPKAYPDFIIRYMTELLGEWEYDPDAYRSLHAIMVPSYFTFDEVAGDDERPYVIL